MRSDPNMRIENVANLRSKGLISVLQDLWEIGYDAEWHCIPASAFGAPHRRDRIWIIAHPACLCKVGLSIGKEKTGPAFGDGYKNASDPDCKRCEHRAYNKQRGYLSDNKNRNGISGSLGLARYVRFFPTPTSRDYKDVGDLKKLAQYAHKSRLACTIAAEELSNGEKSL